MRKPKRVPWQLIVVAAVPIPFLALTDVRTSITYTAFMALIILYVAFKRKVGQEEIIALLFALFITSYHHYIYRGGLNLSIGTINLYPLFCWTIGLVILREIYERLRSRYRFAQATIIYLAVLFLLEYIGYYALNIRLDSNYPSLANLGIIHGPFIIYVFYTLAGPICLLVTNYLKVE